MIILTQNTSPIPIALVSTHTGMFPAISQILMDLSTELVAIMSGTMALKLTDDTDPSCACNVNNGDLLCLASYNVTLPSSVDQDQLPFRLINKKCDNSEKEYLYYIDIDNRSKTFLLQHYSRYLSKTFTPSQFAVLFFIG